MLTQLLIKDFILVDTLDITFESGMTVLTGETGAGKSILVDAISFVLGEKGDTAIIRHGREKAEVSAIIDISKNNEAQEWLKEQDMEAEDGLCLLRRVMDKQGRSRGYINGRSALMSLMRELGDCLIDISGQHAHQLLLKPMVQRNILDSQAGITAKVNQLGHLYQAVKMAEEDYRQATRDAQSIAAEIENCRWEIEDLQPFAKTAENWQEIHEAYQRYSNSANLIEAAQMSLEQISESDFSAMRQMSMAQKSIALIERYDESGSKEIRSLAESADIALTELARSLQHYLDKIDIDPETFRQLEAEVDGAQTVARKYRIEVEEINDRLQASHEKLSKLQTGQDLEALKSQIKIAREAYFELANEISQKREQAAKVISQLVCNRLQELGMQGALFDVMLIPLEIPATFGLEKVEFMLQANQGGQLRPINKVASGGELSRIGLAISTAVSQAASAPILVFDEVDSGIGGRVGAVVGQMLRQLGKHHQVFCVTHLPQVAAYANHQLQVNKAIGESGQTQSDLIWLDENARIEEIARMLGGREVTETTSQHAKEMLEAAGRHKV